MHHDFIIVGSGSAGSVLAARLSEEDGVNVLLIEVGGSNRSPLVTIPMGFIKLFGKERYFWKYEGDEEPGLPDRPQTILHGKGLGGSSSINGMVFVRGHAEDYDEWARLGNSGWAYADVLPYFKRLESSKEGDASYRGRTGPISSRSGFCANPLYEAFRQAAQEAGHPYTPDYNGASQWGVSDTQHAIREGYAKRSSPLREYLRPAMRRKNLQILTGATAARVLFEGSRSVGVEYIKDGRYRRAMASAEVILSAGAYKTPQLLMLSGLGPADELRSLGIKPVQHLPGVGQNLQDHLGSFVQRACSQPVTLLDSNTLWGQCKAAMEYLVTGTGALSHYPAGVLAFLKSQPGLARPDLQFYMAPFLRARADSSVPSLAMTRHGYCISWCQLRPRSRGSVSLSSDNPLAPPRVVHNYLDASGDRECQRHALAMARDLHERNAFAPFRDEELDPGPDCSTPGAVDRYIRETCHTHFHPAGTVAMGHDDMCVVDDKLRVHGVDGLRVVDASIMPRLVGANTNIPTVMIAEKASDLIRNQPPLPREAMN